jgi:hypothetical protein
MQLEPLRAYDEDDDALCADEPRLVTLRPVPLLAKLLESAAKWVQRVLAPPKKEPVLLITDRPHWPPLQPANPAKRPRDEPSKPLATPTLYGAPLQPLPPPPGETLPAAPAAKRKRDPAVESWVGLDGSHRHLEKPVPEHSRYTMAAERTDGLRQMPARVFSDWRRSSGFMR